MRHHIESESSSMPLPIAPANGAIDTATIELLAKWKQEDATKNPEEVRAAERELSEFKKLMNEKRAQSGEPALYP